MAAKRLRVSAADSEFSVKRSALNVERSASAADADNPWPGLAPFTEAQSAQFFGRDAEIKTLARRVQGDPLTVLFGQSGLGKSSLLQAGVFPRLRTADFCPVYIRLDHSPGAPALGEQVKTTVVAETTRFGAWTRPGAARPRPSLWEFFHHRDNRLVSPGGIALSPVLVFDQFEELFTLGGGGGAERQRAVAFMTELAELVENRPPEALVARVEQSPDELETLDFGATDYRVVITLREDYLPHLESLKTIMPALMDNRMRLTRMNGVQALEAVVKPGTGLVTDEVAHAIVEFVAGARGGSVERLAELDVEPSLLSVICRELNERRRALGHAQITADLVSGNRREILTDFYERSVADLPEAMRTFVEDHLLTKSGFRDNLSLESALDFSGVTRPLIDTLVNRRLLRIEDRLGVERVELTHDVLAEVIRTTRDTHHQQLALTQAQARERITRRRMWLARSIAAGLLVVCAGVSWSAWRAIRAEREQSRLRATADRLRVEAEAQKLAAMRKAYASDMNAVQIALANDNLGRARELLERQHPAPGDVDLRGWEWRYLWQSCRSDATEILKEPNDNSVISLASSGDGQWLAAGGAFGGELFVLNLITKEEIKVPAGGGNVRVAFSPREPLLAIGIDSRERGISISRVDVPAGRVLLWAATTRKIVREIPLAGACYAVAFSGDGQTLLVLDVGAEGTLSLWRVADGAKLADWPGGLGFLAHSMPFATTPDLRVAALRTRRDDGISVVDLKTGHERGLIRLEAASLALSPDGTMLATARRDWAVDTTIQLWEVATGREIGRLEGHRGRVGKLEFLPDGKHLVSASADQTLRLWDVGLRTVVRTFRGHKTEVWTAAPISDQRTIVSGCKDGSVYRWDLYAESDTSGTSRIERSAGRAWAFAGGGEFIVDVSAEGHVARRQGRAFQEETPLFDLGVAVVAAVFDQRRPLLAVLNAAGKIQIWDWERRQLVREIPETEGTQQAVPQQFSHHGASLLIGLSAGIGSLSYREWEIATGHETRSFEFPLGTGTRVMGAFSPDGTKFANFIYPSGASQLLDLQSGRITPLKLNVLEPSRPGFSPDGALLAVPSLRSHVRLFDVAANQELAMLGGYLFGVHAATFSPDGKRLVTGGSGVEAIAFWDPQSRQHLLTLAANVNILGRVEFSPDGNVLAGEANISQFGGFWSGPVHLWRAPSWAEIEKAEAAERAGQR
jgi:WD40 repeat protein